LFAVPENSPDFRIFEDGRVKLRRFFSLMIKPQKWSYFLQFVFYSFVRCGECWSNFGIADSISRLMAEKMFDQ